MLSKLQTQKTMLSPNRNTAFGEFYEVISRSLRNQLEGDLLVIFDKLKPVCDAVVARPSIDNLSKYSSTITKLNKEVVQCLHQYLFFPLMSRIKCLETRKRVEIHLKILETVLKLLERITVNNYDMFLKLESSLLTVIFDSNNPGMISDATEEVKYSTIRCLTTLMLHLQPEVREKLLNTQVPMLAQAVFVAVHIAKLEKLRVLRLAAIDCVLAHTMTHPYYDSVEYGKLTTDGRVADPGLEFLIVDKLLANILPGVLAALQDVAVDRDNPGHAVVTAAIEAIHRILCLPMHNKYLVKKDITIKDFMNVVKEKHGKDINTEVSNRGNKNPRDMEKRSPEWFTIAGEKLTLITKSLVVLRTHEHFKVRKELAVFCHRIMTECSNTMPESVPLCMDVLISLSKDEYPEVSQYCSSAINNYFADVTEDTRNDTMDSLCNNFVTLLTSLPRILNNIDSNRKLSALNLLVGYLETLSIGSRLSVALSSARTAQLLCETLTQAAEHSHTHNLTRVVTRDVTSPPPQSSPWSQLPHLDTACTSRLQAACARLAVTQATGTLLDVLTQYYERERDAGTLWVMNTVIGAPDCPRDLVQRILETYLEDELWYNPIEQDVKDADDGDTLDVTVYNPRAWTRDSIPDLYEGTIETRYTDIPLSAPAPAQRGGPPRPPPAHAQLTLACLLTEGVGKAALTLREGYQPYLMKTLCLVLERVGSEYQLLHLAGLKAIADIARATGCESVTDLIRCNADYITNRITASLKKAWNCESALQILSVVMSYSDATMLDCLYGIVEDVLVQSCDKFYEKNLNSYLQVFLTFLKCIQKWFPYHSSPDSIATHQLELDLLGEVEDYVRNTLEAERLLSDSECEKSAEDMFEEDRKKREDGVMDYDDTVTTEKPPLPSHIKVSISLIKRSIHFISSPYRETSLLAIRVASLGVVVLRRYEDELLPLVHAIWAPLVAKFGSQDAVVLREACDLLVVLAECSKDFIRSRTLKEVLPTLYKYLIKSSKDSHLKDVGSSYRTTTAYSLQQRALAALAPLTVHLGLDGDSLAQAMACVQLYLSNKQPKPLQTTAIEFFKTMLTYDYGAAWLHLRALCDNDVTLHPPTTTRIELQPVIGTPYQASDKEYDANVKLVFGDQ